MVDFIASQVVRILNRLQSDKTYTVQDAQEYNKLTTQDLYPLYAKEAWNQVQGPSTAALRGAERWTRRGAHLCNYASNICA